MPVAENHQPVRKRPRAWLSGAGVAALLFVLTVGFFWKLVLTGQYTWLDSPDLSNQVLPWFQFQAGEWHRGRFPLWDPYHWMGQSLIGQAQPGAAYPLNWILFSLPLRHGWIRHASLNWYFVLLHFLAVWFGYLLCRDLRRSRIASIAGGVVFGLGGFVGTNGWPQMLNGAIWAPLIFLFLLRAARGVRPVSSAALSGLFLGISWLSGHHQIPLFLTLTAAGFWIWRLYKTACSGGKPAVAHRTRTTAVAGLAAVCGLFLILTSALQVFPALEYGRLARRWIGLPDPVGWNQPVPYLIHEQYSFYSRSVFGLVIPGFYKTTDPFVGVTAFTLAALALLTRPRSRYVRLFAAIGGWGLLLALGYNSLVHGILYAVVPLVEKARTPSTAILILNLSIAVLSAYGIDSLRSGRRLFSLLAVSRILAVAAAVIYTLFLATILFQKGYPDDRITLTALVAATLAGVLYARHRSAVRGPAVALFCVLLILLELGNESGFFLPNRFDKNRNVFITKLTQYSDLMGFLRTRPWPRRVDIDDQQIPFNAGDWYGFDQYTGYVASAPENIWKLELNTPRVQDLLGVGYTIRREPSRPDQVPLFTGSDGLKVYLNPGAFPRAWAVHKLAAADTRDEAVRLLQDPNFDLRQTAFLPRAGQPRLDACSGPEPVEVVRREPTRVILNATLRCTGLVVLSDAWFPGWQATVDGRAARIYPAYSALRGVVAGPGTHRIEMRYRPRSVFAGALLTGLGFAGALGLVFVDSRKRRGLDQRRPGTYHSAATGP